MRGLFLFVGTVVALGVAADVVVDVTSEIVVASNAPYATRLAAEELNFFLTRAGERTAGRHGADCGPHGDRAGPRGRGGFFGRGGPHRVR